MKKKRLLIYTLSLSLITSYINLNKQKSSDLSKNIIEYTKTFSDDDFQIAAHRGFSSKSVENTSEAIQLAANEPYIDYIEIDTRMTKDNVLVLSHNDDIYESTFSKTEISQTTYEDLENYSFSEVSSNPSTEPQTYSKNIIAIDRKTLSVLYEKNAYDKVAMASTTKIMTCIVVLENCSLDEVVTVSKNAASVSGSTLGLVTDMKITVHDLLYGLMLRSRK